MGICRYRIATLTGTNKVISAKVGIHKIFFKMFKHMIIQLALDSTHSMTVWSRFISFDGNLTLWPCKLNHFMQQES